MRFISVLICSASFLFSLALAPATQPTGLTPDDFDFPSLLGQPPADGSPAQQAEIRQIMALQSSITRDDIARCNREAEITPFIGFDPVLGPSFNAEELPKTAALLKEASAAYKPISKAAKNLFDRHRPFLDPRVKVFVPKEKTNSFPSGHATQAAMWAAILVEIFPDERDALLARAREIGHDRILAGMHYPSDVAAGEKLGAEIARRLLADDHFQADLSAAKVECANLAAHAAGH